MAAPGPGASSGAPFMAAPSGCSSPPCHPSCHCCCPTPPIAAPAGQELLEKWRSSSGRREGGDGKEDRKCR
eukprot:SM000018S03592  [mRNA]  locus=s18:176182:176552:+ [translate_table: standard]